MNKNIYIYILVMAVTVFLIRVLPLTLLRKPIKNKFIKSFLYYVPYVTLAVMTFPAIIDSTTSPIAGLVSLIIGIIQILFGMCLKIVNQTKLFGFQAAVSTIGWVVLLLGGGTKESPV